MGEYVFYLEKWQSVKDQLKKRFDEGTKDLEDSGLGTDILVKSLLDKSKTKRDLCDEAFKESVSKSNTTNQEDLYECCQRMADLCQGLDYGPAGVWMGVFCEEILDLYEDAQYWYNKAAQFKEGYGMYRVGLLYLNKKVPLPKSTSIKRCFQDAADHGVEEAKAILESRFSEESSGAQAVSYEQLFRDITQDVAIAMCAVKIVSQPGLKFFKNDQGIIKGMAIQHTTNPELLGLKNMSEDAYLNVCGMHAFGAGVWVTLKQSKFNKPVSEFSTLELFEIARDFEQTDAYELALNALGVSPSSNNKAVFDHIILTGLAALKKYAGPDYLSASSIEAYMQVLFNAGITLILRN